TTAGIVSQTINVNSATGPLNFTVGDVDTPVDNLTLSVNSSKLALVPTNNIVFGSNGANRTVTVTPAAGETGTATITVSVSDGQYSVSTSFVVTVSTVSSANSVLQWSRFEAAVINTRAYADPYRDVTLNVTYT